MSSPQTPALPRRAHAQRARELLEQIARGTRPADQWVEALFRAHKEMGKRDRASISALVYGVLRDVLRLQALAGEAPAAWLSRHLADAGHSAEAITTLDLPSPAEDAAVPVHATLNLPLDWHARLSAQNGEAHTAALAAALRLEAPVDLRINTLKGTREQAQARLHEDGIAVMPTPYSPWGLRLAKRLSHTNRLLAEGLAEPQDEGSQLLALLVAAQPGETVVDYCAGAGGKSLALAAMMGDEGRLIACDITASRLAKVAPRAARGGVSCIETRTLTDGPPQELIAQADAVLVDAPCSGSGTLRRSPELRLKPADVPALAQLQAQILQDASTLVRPGGRLIYATCSLFAEENEQVVQGFLASHPGYARDASATQRLPLLQPDGSLRLWPQLHGSDGFYACALRRA